MKDEKSIKSTEKKPRIIKEEKLLIVDGKDEENFFQALFKKKDIRGVQIVPAEGKDNFDTELSANIKATGSENLKSLALLRDADQSAKNAFESVRSALKNNKLPSPMKSGEFATDNSLKVGVFIIPDGINEGMLESLCLSTVKGEGIMKCIDSFMECVRELPQNDKTYKQPKNWEKARVRAFLSAMEEDTRDLGVAAQKGYWNWDSDKLKPLLNFLRNL